MSMRKLIAAFDTVLFTIVSMQKIGTSAVQSALTRVVCWCTIVCPAWKPRCCRDAMDEILASSLITVTSGLLQTSSNFFRDLNEHHDGIGTLSFVSGVTGWWLGNSLAAKLGSERRESPACKGSKTDEVFSRQSCRPCFFLSLSWPLLIMGVRPCARPGQDACPSRSAHAEGCGRVVSVKFLTAELRR